MAIPDAVRVDRARRSPELGPRIVFFSGGSALKKLSRQLKLYTHNSVHLITPFDSGGSSAELRRAFGMPSVGDLRNRLLALADETVRGNPDVYRLFSYRLPRDDSDGGLRSRLDCMVSGDDALVEAVSPPLRRLVRTQLGIVRERLPEGFDLRGASIGNLALAGGYLHEHGDMESVLFLFSKLVGALGTVRLVTDADLQLVARLEDGSQLVGQHLLTGKEVPPIASPIARMWAAHPDEPEREVRPAASEYVLRLIRKADLIVFPPGSFYTSVLANLLPAGVGRAIAEAPCPRVFVPNTFPDPEQLGVSSVDALARLEAAIRADGVELAGTAISHVLLDDRVCPPRVHDEFRDREPEAVRLPLVGGEAPGPVDPERLAHALITLAS